MHQNNVTIKDYTPAVIFLMDCFFIALTNGLVVFPAQTHYPAIICQVVILGPSRS
jgi:hypothetical protein